MPPTEVGSSLQLGKTGFRSRHKDLAAGAVWSRAQLSLLSLWRVGEREGKRTDRLGERHQVFGLLIRGVLSHSPD